MLTISQAVGGGQVAFTGTWGHYAFPSGYVFVNTIGAGGYVVKLNTSAKRGVGKFRRS